VSRILRYSFIFVSIAQHSMAAQIPLAIYIYIEFVGSQSQLRFATISSDLSIVLTRAAVLAVWCAAVLKYFRLKH
jgi:hypothetical protein